MRRTLLVCLFLLAIGKPAFADVTVFLGVNGAPYVNQSLTGKFTWGVAVDSTVGSFMGLKVALEGEYADTGRPPQGLGYRTLSLDVLLRAPKLGKLQFYGAAGGSFYQESFRGVADTGVGGNVGAGLKVPIWKPFGLRADYRVFFLQNAYQTPMHRGYLGASVEF